MTRDKSLVNKELIDSFAGFLFIFIEVVLLEILPFFGHLLIRILVVPAGQLLILVSGRLRRLHKQ